MKYLVFLFLLIISLKSNYSQNTIIKGNAPSYAGEELTFFVYGDRISFTEKNLDCWYTETKDIFSLTPARSMKFFADMSTFKGPVFIDFDTTYTVKCIIDKDGNFLYNFNLKETVLAMINLEAYKGFIYLEPGKIYDIKLPTKKMKTDLELLNPYFKPVEFYLKILNSQPKDLNSSIEDFDNDYDIYISTNAADIYTKKKSSGVDSAILDLDNKFKDIDNQFFNTYKEYRFASLRYLAYQRDPIKIIKKYYQQKSFYFENPAYQSLLRDVSKIFLNNLSKTKECKELWKVIFEEDNLSNIKQKLLLSGLVLSDTLMEFILLTSLYDGFYSKEVPLDIILKNITLIDQQSNIAKNKEISANIRRKVTKLLPGFNAPDFELRDQFGKIARLSLFKGKYLYFNFYNSKSYSSMQDLPALENIYKKHKNILEIITFSIDENFENTKKIFKEKEYNWTLIKCSTLSNIVIDYNIKAYPTYYLLDSDGKLILSPAPAPSNEFEERFTELYVEKERERLRNKGK